MLYLGFVLLLQLRSAHRGQCNRPLQNRLLGTGRARSTADAPRPIPAHSAAASRRGKSAGLDDVIWQVDTSIVV